MVRAFCLLAPLAVAIVSGLTPTPASAQDEKPYSVVNGKVDKGTFNGWRRYTDACMRCHGPDGSGSSYGPVLSNSLKTMTYEQFTDTVINGRKNVTSSQQNVMPAFGEVQDVAMNIDDIYAYLKARADGAVGRGRPEKQ